MLKKFIVFYFILFYFIFLQSLHSKETQDKYTSIVILKKSSLSYDVRELIKLALKKKTFNQKIQSLKTTLKIFYATYGYFQFKITVKEKKFSHYTTYLIDINKGKQSKINKIAFLGNIQKPSHFYKKIFLKNSDPIIQSHIYNPNLVKESLKEFILYLKNQAYLTAKSVSIKKNWIKPQLVNLSFIIEEGPLSKVQNITWEGITEKEEAKLLPLLKIQLNSNLIIKDLTNSDLFTILTFFKNASYLDVKFKDNKKLITYDAQQQASLTYQIIKGKQAKLNNTIITGNKFTKTLTIKKAIPIKKGFLITPKILKTIYFNLENLNIFSEIKVTLKPSKNKDYNKNLYIKVKEKKRTRFNTKLTAQSAQYNSLSTNIAVSFEKRNLKGTGRKIYTDAQIKNKLNSNIIEYKTSLQYDEPFLFSSNVKANVKIQTQKDIIDFNPETHDYSLLRSQTSLSLRLNKKFNKYFSSYWTVLKFNKIIETSQNKKIHNSNTLNSTSLFNTFDFRDSAINPREGHYEDFQIFYSRPLLNSSKNIHFLQFISNMEYYVPLGKVTWAQRLSLGYAKNLLSTTGSGIPSNFAFFLGGPSSLRGYSGGSDRFPSPAELPLDKSNALIIKDFTYFYLLKSELRFPLFKSFYTSVFYDIGSIKVDNLNFYNPIRSSYGIGFHFSTPIGVLSLNYGLKINSSPDEDNYAIHLNVGSF